MNTLTIVYKEWKEMLRSRLVVFNIALIPGIFVSLPLILALLLMREDAVNTSLASGQAVHFGNVLLTSAEEIRVYLLHQSLFMFLMVPIFLPLGMAIYGILNEKEHNTLEPLLATPVTVGELMLGKSLSIVGPTVAATWLAFGFFAVCLTRLTTPAVFVAIMRPMTLIAIALLPPLLAQLTVSLGLIISSRVNDIRAAGQIGGIIVLPVVGLTVMQLASRIVYDLTAFFLGAVGLLILDCVLFGILLRAFQRDTVLTRWQS
ncbi:MAG: ABC transporter permease subunit [Chloroflexi bacterium]|nr:ABC transporter permease subunit [Chloroflexota bacterium]